MTAVRSPRQIERADEPLTAECPTPLDRALMVQRWADVVFLHWRYEPASVQARLPVGLVVDTFDGSAWVGLVPFRMEGLGFPGLAPLPHVGRFPEVNVRTYVRHGHQRGVWFFSLDVDRALPVAVARTAYHLPYCLADAAHERRAGHLVTRVRRRWPAPARFGGTRPTTDVAVRLGDEAAADDALSRFLTARWGLFSATRRGQLRYAPVDHPAWPLRRADLTLLDDRLVTAAGLPAPGTVPHVLWSPGVDVRVGRPIPVARRP